MDLARDPYPHQDGGVGRPTGLDLGVVQHEAAGVDHDTRPGQQLQGACPQLQVDVTGCSWVITASVKSRVTSPHAERDLQPAAAPPSRHSGGSRPPLLPGSGRRPSASPGHLPDHPGQIRRQYGELTHRACGQRRLEPLLELLPA